MKRQDALNLFTALTDKSLKTKNVDKPGQVENLLSLDKFRKEVKKYINEMNELENDLLSGYEESVQIMTFPGGGSQYVPKDDTEQSKAGYKDFLKKLNEIHKADFTPSQLNFIPNEEFKKWVDEADSNIGLTLSEYLRKE